MKVKKESCIEPVTMCVQDLQNLRIIEAVLFASAEPVSQQKLQELLSENADIDGLMVALQENYAQRGVNIVQIAGNWTLRTAEDLSHILRKDAVEPRKLSKAGIETLAIIAYHQPITRAEIEEIRGVALSGGTLDQLLELNWVQMRGRRRTPGRPVTYETTNGFLEHFGLNMITDLPGLAELKGAGLLEAGLPADFSIPIPAINGELAADEEALDSESQDPYEPLDMHTEDKG